MSRKVNCRFVLIMVFIVLLTGCSNNNSDDKYFDSASKFNKIYFEVVECIDSNRLTESIENLQSQTNKKKINELSSLITDIKNSIPQKREILYDSFKNRHDDLLYLQNIYSEINTLSEEQKRKIYGIFTSINLYKNDWKDKNSIRVWE